MRTLAVLLTVLILPIAAAAEGPTTTAPATAPDVDTMLPDAGHAMLRLSPMYVEIRDIIAAADEREAEMLKELAAAETDAQVEILVARIKNLAVDRELDVLRIQARYARLEGRFELEKKLKARMAEVLDTCGRKPGDVQSVQAVK